MAVLWKKAANDEREVVPGPCAAERRRVVCDSSPWRLFVGGKQFDFRIVWI